MSRKSLILCLAVLLVMISGIGIAVSFLYSDFGSEIRKESDVLREDSRYSLLSAVPSDAALVGCFSRSLRACSGVLSGFELTSSMSAAMQKGILKSCSSVPMTVSLHYSGRLVSLFLFSIGSDEEKRSALESFASAEGLSYAADNGIFIMSESETLVKSSLRHLAKGVSVMDARGFADAASSAAGRNPLFISNLHSDKLFSALFTKRLAKYSSFFERLAEWTVFETDHSSDGFLSLKGQAMYEGTSAQFMTVLSESSASKSSVAEILPSYTLFAASLPMKEVQPYMSAYQAYVDSRQGLQKFQARQKELGGKLGIKPDDFFRRLEVREVAVAAFKTGSRLEKVNLMKVGECDVELIFKGTDVESLRDYSPSVHSWPYASFMASSFGSLFELEDESCFTYIDGWIVTGSLAAVNEYAKEGRALSYTLSQYLADAGKPSLLSSRQTVFQSYFSFTEDAASLGELIKPDFLSCLSRYYEDCDTCPAVLCIEHDKKNMSISLDVFSLELHKTKAPEFERDTVVAIPEGPFKVMNSHTGKTNTFYQNKHKSLCLQDENGKDMWGVPFKQDICGTVHNVDYYANGKLQFIFGAGSRIYLMDRLGRFVNGFPVDLGKEILLGPDVYDFNGTRKYNIIVLHKDKSIQMYNLKGQKPSLWKGIKSSDTIKGLPERIVAGGSGYWVVRTSKETLIYPFYGGDPLTVFEGDRKIRPDSEVRVVEGSSVEVRCYDGKSRTVSLK